MSLRRALITRRRFLASTAAAGTLAGIAGFSRPSLADSTVKVGVVLPFSGGLELFGNQGKIGLELAKAEINARRRHHGDARWS